jgi:hypothetical protein
VGYLEKTLSCVQDKSISIPPDTFFPQGQRDIKTGEEQSVSFEHMRKIKIDELLPNQKTNSYFQNFYLF